MSPFSFPPVCPQLYHAGADAQPYAHGKGQSVLSAAHGQLHHAIVCQADIHCHPLHERRNSHQVSVDNQWDAEDQDTVRHLRQCQHQRYWQGMNAQHCWGTSSIFIDLLSPGLTTNWKVLYWRSVKKRRVKLFKCSSFFEHLCNKAVNIRLSLVESELYLFIFLHVMLHVIAPLESRMKRIWKLILNEACKGRSLTAHNVLHFVWSTISWNKILGWYWSLAW